VIKLNPLLWLYIVSFLHGLGVNSSSTVFPVYMRDLGGTEFLVSLSQALFFLVRGCFTFFSGVLSDTLGRRQPIILSFLLFSLAHVLYALSRTPGSLLASISVQGIAAGFYWPVVFALISGYSNSEDSAHNISRFLLAFGIGGVIGSWLGGKIADSLSPQMTFWSGCTVLSLACLSFSFLVPEAEQPRNDEKFDFRHILQVPPKVRRIALLAAAATVVWAVLTVGMPLRLRDLGASYSFIGGTRAVSQGINFGIVALAPFIIGRLGFQFVLPSYLLLCGLLMIGVKISSGLLTTAALFSLFWGSAGMDGVGWTALVEKTAPTGKVGTSMGILRGLRDFFSLGYLLIFGFVAQHWNMPAAFIFVAVVLIGLSVTIGSYLKSQLASQTS